MPRWNVRHSHQRISAHPELDMIIRHNDNARLWIVVPPVEGVRTGRGRGLLGGHLALTLRLKARPAFEMGYRVVAGWLDANDIDTSRQAQQLMNAKRIRSSGPRATQFHTHG